MSLVEAHPNIVSLIGLLTVFHASVSHMFYQASIIATQVSDIPYMSFRQAKQMLDCSRPRVFDQNTLIVLIKKVFPIRDNFAELAT